jgi:peptide/nickel transport system substrate-binding protein
MDTQDGYRSGGLTRRDLLRCGALTVGGLAAGSSLAVRPTPSKAMSVAKDEVADTSTLVLAVPEVPTNLDREFTFEGQAFDVLQNTMEEIVEWHQVKRPDGSYTLDFSAPMQPRLAESWSYSPGFKTLTINLRQGVISEYGNELTAEDFKWTYDRAYFLKSTGTFFLNTMFLRHPNDWKVTGRYQVQLTPDRPNEVLLPIQPQPYMSLFDSTECKKHATAGDPWATKWLAQNTAGFGPYRLISRVTGQQLVMEARPSFYRGTPALKQIIFREVPTSANRLALLSAGAVDVAFNLLPVELASARNLPGLKVISWPANSLDFVFINLKDAPFDKVQVRQALNYALPRAQILTTSYFGTATPILSSEPSSWPFFNSSVFPYTENLDKAKALLSEAGLPNGFSAPLAYNAAVPEHETLAILYQTNLAKIGVKLTLNKLPAATFTQKLLQRAFPLALDRDEPNVPDPGYANFLYFDSKSFFDLSNYHNPQVDDLIDTLIATFDIRTRRSLTLQIQKLIVNDAPWVFGVQPGFHITMRSNVNGATWYTQTTNQFFNWTKS